MSQNDMAFLLGMKTPSQISRWERGTRIPDTDSLFKLAAIFRRLPSDLLWERYARIRDRVLLRERRFRAHKRDLTPKAS